MTKIDRKTLLQPVNGEEISENALLLLMEVANIGTTSKGVIDRLDFVDLGKWFKESSHNYGCNSNKPMPDHPNLHRIMQ